MQKKLTIIILAMILFFCAACSEVAKHSAEREGTVKVVVVTGGHDFDSDSFFQMFSSFKNVDYVESRQKDDSEIFEDVSNFDFYDVIVLYNMSQRISEKRKKNFVDILNKGKGLIVLHHAVGAFDDWREYEKIIGARYLHKDSIRNGMAYKKSSYKHDVDLKVNIARKQHPVTRGIDDFDIHDETYKGCFFEKDNNVLLTTNEPTSDKSIGWTRKYGNSKICYIQLGHGPETYNDGNYRTLVANAIKWSASR